MRARLIVNPTATTTNAAVRRALVGLLGSEVELSVAGTRARLHASDLARQAVADGVDAVFALGGDGTANEVLQGLAGTDVAFGVLPGGGANVLARALGLPRDATAAAAQQLQRLFDGDDHRLGLGEVNGRLFGFQAGVGLDAGIVRRVEAHPIAKRVLRQLAFVLLGLREWATSEDRHDPACVVHGLDGLDADPRMLVTVGNLSPYTYLGPRAFDLVPTAAADRGLAVLAVRPLTTRRVLRAVVQAFVDGGHVSDDDIDLVSDVGSLSIEAGRPVPLMVDGDLVDHVTRVNVRHRPGLLRVLVDPRDHAQGTHDTPD